MNTITTREGTIVTWEGELEPDTLVTLNGAVTVPVGSWIAMSQGDAFTYIDDWVANHPTSDHS